MKYILLMSLLFFYPMNSATSAHKKLIKVAVIDSGLDLKDHRFKKYLCSEGHNDFTSEGIQDDYGHGTHVVGLIKEYAKDANYCLIILKYWSVKQNKLDNSTYLSALAFKKAVDLKVDIVNYSSGGSFYGYDENRLIKNNPNILFVTAAGNNNDNLDIQCDYYPCCYNLRNLICVGALDHNGIEKFIMSNFGEAVNAWEIGENVLSTLPSKCKEVCEDQKGRESGTSMSAAIRTGKLIYELSK